MSTFHITIEVNVEDGATAEASEAVSNAIYNLVDVMTVQAEDGLYSLGSPESFNPDEENVHIADCWAQVGRIVEVANPDERFVFNKPGSVQGFIETGSYSTVAEDREING